MICIQCSHNNPATIGYCQRCGAKMDFTADQIQAALVEKKKGEVVQNTEFYAKQALTFAVVIFLLTISLFFLAGGAPEDGYAIPSMSLEGKHVEVEYKLETEMPKALIPLDPKK
jgi:hypothetical protein